MTGRLAGKIALITGAGCVGPGWGNGRAMAVRFAQEGAKVFAVDRDLERIGETVERVRSAGGTIETYQANVTNSAAVALMVRAYGNPPAKIYFMGSSEGGREALTMAQRYPDDFDGIFARVPVINWVGLQHAGTRSGLATRSLVQW